MKSSEWWHGAVIYEVYLPSFYDASGDGWGDLCGLFQRLDHIASLGVDAIWITPFYPSPMEDFGYDVAEFRDVDGRFGNLEVFGNLVAVAISMQTRWRHHVTTLTPDIDAA